MGVKGGCLGAETSGMRVLLVEDDADIAAPLVRGLEREGFEVTHHETGGGALEASEGPDGPDVVLLDLGLPDLDGFEVCRRMRSGSEVPIIVVTARGDEVDRVVGLELGADDYVVKPFGIRELVARIRAVARRAPARAVDSPVSEIGPLVVDRRARRVTMAAEELLLTPKEFDLLAALAEDPGAACSRQHLLDVVWDPHWYGPTKTVDVHVANLRRKLGDARWIETVRGVGYRLADPGAIP
jgi:two-component system, OmpR family, response regulator RegX3